MSSLNPRIFREYDIRGIAEADLTDEVVFRIARAYATFIGGGRVLIGMDNRASSERIKQAFISGLIASGCDVWDLELTLSPIFYFARLHYGIDGGVMITASHNPAEFNGFKLCKGSATMYGADIQKLYALAQAGNFISGEGTCQTVDVTSEYYDLLLEKITLTRQFRVVVDCGNGSAGLFVPQALAQWGCEVIPLYCEPDPTFPNHEPDPVRPDFMQDLAAAVKTYQADLGIGYDGDGDRLGVVDDQGTLLFGDQLLILFFREFLAKHPRAPCLIEVKCSQALVDDVTLHGGTPMFCKTGHSLIKARMLEEDALLAGEMSGHMFFRDEFLGTDDALYATGRLLRILDSLNVESLSQLIASLPHYYATPEIRLSCPDERKFAITKQLVSYFSETALAKKKDVILVDGIRVVFEDGWGLVRASNTQPALIFRCEGKTVAARDRIYALFMSAFKAHAEITLPS